MSELTERQREVLDFIADHIVAHQRPPTYREIMAGFGWSSTNSVADVIKALVSKKYINADPFTRRGIYIRGRTLAWEK